MLGFAAIGELALGDVPSKGAAAAPFVANVTRTITWAAPPGNALAQPLGRSIPSLPVDTTGTSRYWVGGTGAWNSTNPTNWSKTSGGANMASPPESSTDVFFDGNSGGGTVTGTGGNISTLDTTGYTGTLAGTSPNIGGSSCTIGAGTTISWNAPGLQFFAGAAITQTLTTNGVDIVNGVRNFGSGTVSLADALTCSAGTVQTTSGGLTTNNFAVVCASFTTGSTATLTLGSSVITITSAGTPVTINSGTTLNAGTSTFKFTNSSSSSRTFVGGGKTFYNFWHAPGTGTGILIITGSNTFNDFKDDGSVAHTIQFTAGTTQTVSSLTVNGNAGNLISLHSTSAGSVWTVSDASGVNVCDYVSIKDSTASGGATFNATNSTDEGNNTGWVFGAINPIILPLNAQQYYHIYDTRNALSAQTQGTQLRPTDIPSGSPFALEQPPKPWVYNSSNAILAQVPGIPATLQEGPPPFILPIGVRPWIYDSRQAIAAQPQGTPLEVIQPNIGDPIVHQVEARPWIYDSRQAIAAQKLGAILNIISISPIILPLEARPWADYDRSKTITAQPQGSSQVALFGSVGDPLSKQIMPPQWIYDSRNAVAAQRLGSRVPSLIPPQLEVGFGYIIGF